jgi:hypothetical protein
MVLSRISACRRGLSHHEAAEPRNIGTNENAVKTQVWCAIATYVLIAIVKKELRLDASPYTCLHILSVSVFEKTEVSCALRPDRPQAEPPPTADQFNLFGF